MLDMPYDIDTFTQESGALKKGAKNVVTRKLETLYIRNDMLNICPEIKRSVWKSKFVDEALEAIRIAFLKER